jgi:prophage regulatory protein
MQYTLDKILRIADVQNQTGAKRSTIYNRIAEGTITRAVSLGGRTVGWPQSEIARINGARIAGQSDEQIRALVCQLHQARAKAVQHEH